MNVRKRFIEETGKNLVYTIGYSDIGENIPSEDYVNWLENRCDRLESERDYKEKMLIDSGVISRV